MDLKENKCKFCNNLDIKKVDNYRFKHKIFANIKIVFCKKCDLYFALPAPQSYSLDNYYNAVEGVSIGSPNSGKLNISFANILAKSRLQYIYINLEDEFNKNNLNVLEVGSGYGHLAKYFVNKYNINKYYIVESDTRCHKELKKISKYVFKNLDDINDTGSIDILILSHILEHLSDPINFLKRIENKFKIKYIFIDVPCEDYLYKEIDEPHLYFYNTNSLKKLSDICGYKVKNLQYFGDNINKINDKQTITKKLFNKFYTYLFFTYLFVTKSNQKYNMTILEYIMNNKYKANKLNTSKARWIRGIFEIEKNKIYT